MLLPCVSVIIIVYLIVEDEWTLVLYVDVCATQYTLHVIVCTFIILIITLT